MNTYGTVIEIKRPKTLDFRSLEESIRNPDFSRDPSGCGGVTDFDKFGRAEFLHLLTYALDEYEQVRLDTCPKLGLGLEPALSRQHV